MEIQLRTDRTIRLTAEGEGFALVPGEASLSPFHLLAASLATCTYSVLAQYATPAGIPIAGLAVDVSWELGGDPYRVTRMDMAIDWPDLPENRRTAATRVAARCTIHHTLHQGTTVDTRVVGGPGG